MKLTLLTLVVLEELEALEGGTAGDQLVGELGLVVVAAIAVDLLVSVLRFTLRQTCQYGDVPREIMRSHGVMVG